MNTPPRAVEAADLAAIRARCETATEGPWRREGPIWHDGKAWGENVGLVNDDHENGMIVGTMFAGRGTTGRQAIADYDFIAHARTDIPAFLALAERGEAVVAENARLRALLTCYVVLDSHGLAGPYDISSAWPVAGSRAGLPGAGHLGDAYQIVRKASVEALGGWDALRASLTSQPKETA